MLRARLQVTRRHQPLPCIGHLQVRSFEVASCHEPPKRLLYQASTPRADLCKEHHGTMDELPGPGLKCEELPMNCSVLVLRCAFSSALATAEMWRPSQFHHEGDKASTRLLCEDMVPSRLSFAVGLNIQFNRLTSDHAYLYTAVYSPGGILFP